MIEFSLVGRTLAKIHACTFLNNSRALQKRIILHLKRLSNIHNGNRKVDNLKIWTYKTAKIDRAEIGINEKSNLTKDFNRMKLERYELKAEKSLMIFEFVSEGLRGEISKLVQFGETNLKDVYNLAFGDKDQTTGEIDDSIISNNGDSGKVLATVVATVYAFTDKHPEAWVYATGSTKSRTRLYRMGLTKYFLEIAEDFDLYGQKEGEWENFQKGVEYEAFLAQRKND